MVNKWYKYYKEIFRTYQSGFFIKMWGTDTDEYGDDYEDVYKYELRNREEHFADFMLLHQKYNIDYDERAIGLFIINMFECLGDCDYPEGAFEMARMIIYAIKHRIGFNDVWHPEGKPI